MRKLKIAGAALNQIPIDWKNNTSNIIEAIEEARKRHIKILCLPELCITGYGCEDLFLSAWLPEKAKDVLLTLLPACKDITVAIGLPMKLDNTIYNCAAVVQDEKIIGISAKQFLANDGVHYEPRWFTPWQSNGEVILKIGDFTVPFGDVTYDLYGVKTGFEICEDAWRPNRPAYRLNERGVELILNPSASHFAFGKSKIRENIALEASEKFSCYYLYANLLGNEAGRMIYDGEILIAGHGKVLNINGKLSFKNFNIVEQEIDFDGEPVSLKSKPVPEEDKNEIFTQAEALALFDYLRKSHSKGFVVSLSGGADSSTCALLVSEMVRRSLHELGLQSVLELIHFPNWFDELSKIQPSGLAKSLTHKLLTCAYQGTINSSEETFQSAKQLADDIGAQFYHWLIDDEVNNYSSKIEKALGRKLDWNTDDLAMQNIQSRSRAPIIWMLANIRNALLLVTSNRSEGDVGYATMDGDTSGSIAPIAAVDKFFIINWLKWAEKKLNYRSLSLVNALSPTAELRPPDKRQTDETDLMPYRVIVEIEKLAIRDRHSPLEIYHKLKEKNLEDDLILKAHIKKFFSLWCRNQWKRERTAPAFHLDDFNVDPRTWCRFPILSSGYQDELAMLDE